MGIIENSLSIYPKVTKIFCLQRFVACEVHVIIQRNFILQFSIGSKAARDNANQIAHVRKSRGSLGNNKHGG